MEKFKGRGRRLSLMAGASSFAAALASSVPVLLAPSGAQAANECGALAATVICTGTFAEIDYAPISTFTMQLRAPLIVTTGGISITTSGNGNVTVSRTTDSPALSGDPQITNTSGAGLSVVRSAGDTAGNITATLSDNDVGDADLAITGTTAGVELLNVGSGSTTLTTVEGTITATNGYGVRLGAGTGNVTFTNGAVVTGTAGSLQVIGGGNATLTNNETLNGGIVFNNTGNVTLNNQGVAIGGPGSEVFTAVISGALTFNNAGTTTFTNRGIWRNASATFNPASNSTLNNNEIIQIEGNVEFTGLDTFNQGNLITFGTGEDIHDSDGLANDRLMIPTNLTLTRPSITGREPGQSKFVMDFADGGVNQPSCAAAISADCLDMRGFTVDGVESGTWIELRIAPATSFAVAEKMVLVDASGGSIDDFDFVLLDDSEGYRLNADGEVGIDSGMLMYRFVVDEDADQVYLTAIGPGSTSGPLFQLSEAPHAVWDLGSSAIIDRQEELRDRGDEGAGVWLRGLSSSVDDSAGVTFGGFDFEGGYDQEITGVMGGGDFMVGDVAIGIAAGSFNGELRSGAVTGFSELSGYGLGAYGSWTSGGVFANALVNHSSVDLTAAFGAEESEASSTGALAEAGWRFRIADGIAFEPMAALSWVSTDSFELTLDNGAVIGTDELTSLNAGLGVRVAGVMPMGGLTARFGVSGRGWLPLGDDEVSISMGDGASSTAFAYEDNQDVLGDVGLTAGLDGLDGRLSLSATGRLKFKESYQDSQLLVGLRYRF